MQCVKRENVPQLLLNRPMLGHFTVVFQREGARGEGRAERGFIRCDAEFQLGVVRWAEEQSSRASQAGPGDVYLAVEPPGIQKMMKCGQFFAAIGYSRI